MSKIGHKAGKDSKETLSMPLLSGHTHKMRQVGPGRCAKPPSVLWSCQSKCLHVGLCPFVTKELPRGANSMQTLGWAGRMRSTHSHFPGAASGKWPQPHCPWLMSATRNPSLPHLTRKSFPFLGPQFPHMENDSWVTPHRPCPAPTSSDSKTCVQVGGCLFRF